MAIQLVADQPAQCSTYLKALADPMRLRIVQTLQSNTVSVSDLAVLLDSEIANVSHHLRVLFHAGIVTTKRVGKYAYYSLNTELLGNKKMKSSKLDFGCCTLDLRRL